MDLSAARQAFIQEAMELLETMEASLLGFAETPTPQESINAIFRAIHTIKGSAGLFDFEEIVSFSHVVENILDQVRGGVLALDPPLVGLMLDCHDHLKQLTEALDGTEGPASDGKALLDQLHAYQNPPPQTATPSEVHQTPTDCWHLSMRLRPDALREGMDPASILRYLQTLGQFRHVDTLTELIPEGASFDPETSYLQVELDLESQASREEIEGAFEFVREDSLIRLIPPREAVKAYLSLIEAMPDVSRRLGEILVRSGALSRQELEHCLAKQAALREEGMSGARLGELLVNEEAIPAAVVEAAISKQRTTEDRRRESRFIKVEANRLDHLINLVGELVIAGAATNLLVREGRLEALLEATSAFTGLIEQIRSGALAMRMVQVGEVFNRFPRVVRDLSEEIGKGIDLHISGGEAELDKSMVEKLSDPLTHLVRNAMDHGIEGQEERQAAGKPARGNLSLHAYHESGSIVIEVSDDGKGLDRSRILAKALERGLISPDQNLTDQEIYKLIFEPGFSTAAAVTKLSGRGVGMDVVKRNLDQLRGTIDIDSRPGRGTTFRLRLPLTLAIIDSFMVEVGGACFVIPLDFIKECIEDDREVQPLQAGYVALRGEVLPLVNLREVFGIEAPPPERSSIVVVSNGERKAGIVVDILHGELQAVIKPLGRMFSHLKPISGSTILGSGHVALILDAAALIQSLTQKNTEILSLGHEMASLKPGR